MTKKQIERAEAIEGLKKSLRLRPGQTVYTCTRHTSRSGMQRSISVHIMDRKRGQLCDISGHVAKALDYRLDHVRGGVKIGGCGMDMGFHLVYNLGRVMCPDGYRCAGEKCQGNDHSNKPWPKRDGKPMHHDGGYAFRHEWI